MKKNKTKIFVSLLLALFLAFALVGCGGSGETVDLGEPALTRYTVTVENGTGGGEYRQGKEVTVTATVPDGKMFAKWVSDGEVVSTENPYTFTPTEDITLTAVVGTPYDVVVEGGRIGDTLNTEAQVVENESVTVTATSTVTRTFLYWIVNGDTENQISDNPYTFTVKADTTLQAVYDEIYLISVSDGSVYPQGKPDEAARSMRFEGGAVCTIKANDSPSGQRFAYWYYINEDSEEVVLSESEEFTFPVTQSRKIYAKYDFYYTVNVTGGYIGEDTSATSATIWEGDEATVTAVIPENKGFVRWTVNGETVSTSYRYSFTVEEDVTLVAEFADLIKLETPANDANQMFNYVKYSDTRNTTEFDRQKNEDGSRKTVFVDGVDYVLYYIYTSPTADKEDYVGQFKLDQADGGTAATVVTMDGSSSIGAGSTPGDYYIDNTGKEAFYAFFRAAIGEDYDAYTQYYFAAQVVGYENSIYIDSEISEIGTSYILEGTAYTVEVNGGALVDPTYVGVNKDKIAAGASVTVKATVEDGYYFDHWEVDGQNVSSSEEYTFTVAGDTVITAITKEITDETATITVEGGTIEGYENTTEEVAIGTEVTVVATVPEGWFFVRWTVNGDPVSTSASYTFRVSEDVELKAETSDKITLATPANDSNQMFKYVGYGDNRNTTEFDRQKETDGQTSKTAFVEGVDYVLYYIYTSPNAEKTDYVGQFMLVQTEGTNAVIRTMDGSVSIGAGSTPGNYYIDNTAKETYFAFFRAAIGEDYDAYTQYYFAAQAVAVEDSLYTDSEISEIGTSGICEQQA